MLSVEHLKIIVAVAESQSLREAAEKLFKTQPAISQAIKQIESQLGLDLFYRDAYRLKLNDQGLYIYEKAKLALTAHNEVLLAAQDFNKGYEPKVVVAIEASFDLQKALRAFELTQQRFPHTQITIIQQYMSGAYEMLEREEAHLAISPTIPGVKNLDNIASKHILDGGLLNVATPKLLARHGELLSVKQLVNEYLVVVKDSGSRTDGLSVGVPTAQRRWYVNDFSAKLTLIESGMGWGRLPQHLVRRQLESGELVLLALQDFPNTVEVKYDLLRLFDVSQGPVSKYLWESF